jgi:hypothetical protein
MKRHHIVTGLAISLSLFAACFAALAWRQGRPAEDAASLRQFEERADALGEKLDRVVENLDSLALRLDRLAVAGPGRGEAADGSVVAEGDRDALAAPEPVRAIVERLEGIAGRIERASASAGPGAGPGGVAAETAEDRARIVEENKPIAMDPRRTPEERILALRELRQRDGRSREVVLPLLDLMETPDLNPRMRADIIRNLEGVEIPELKESLLRILENDRHPETRAETVESLQVFYGDPAVHAAVVNVRDNDENIRVRMEALERLAEYDEVKARLDKAAGR